MPAQPDKLGDIFNTMLKQPVKPAAPQNNPFDAFAQPTAPAQATAQPSFNPFEAPA